MAEILTAFLAAGSVNWRFAIALTGILCAVYGVIYFFNCAFLLKEFEGSHGEHDEFEVTAHNLPVSRQREL